MRNIKAISIIVFDIICIIVIVVIVVINYRIGVADDLGIKINVVVVIPERDNYTDLLQFFDRFKVDFAIATFPEWNFDLIPYCFEHLFP